MNLVEQAIIFATKAHEGQYRKMSHIPYILHPLEVANIIATLTEDENVIAAGILHDTIEDCNVDPNEISSLFGKTVFALVQSETEDKMPLLSAEDSWKTRKEDSILYLKNSNNINVKILWLSDKLSNIRSFYREYLKNGYAFLNKLHQKDPKMQHWYYKSIADNTTELSNTSAYKEYISLVDKVFGDCNE